MNLLLVCDDENSIKSIKKYILSCDNTLVISNNSSVISEAIKLNRVSAHLVDSDSPINNQETWGIINKINTIIDEADTFYPNYLYQISYLLEGGAASSISDMIYYIGYIFPLLDGIQYNRFITDSCDTPISNAAECIARSMGCKLEYLSGSFRRRLSRSKIAYCLRRIRTAVNFYKCVSKDFNDEALKDEMWVLHSSNSNKQIGWQEDNFKQYILDFNYRIICINANYAYTYFLSRNYNVLSIENYYPLKFSNVLKDFFISYKEIDSIVKAIDEKFKYSFDGLDVSQVVIRICTDYIRKSVLRNILYFNAIDAFVSRNDSDLLTGDGDTNNIINRIFHDRIEYHKKSCKFFKECASISLFDENALNIYEPYSNVFDIRIFHPDSKMPSILTAQGWNGKMLFSNKTVRLDSDDGVIRERNDSEKFRVLWAPSYPFVGLYSLADFHKDNEMISRLCHSSDVELYIKYHPNQLEEYVREFKKLFDGEALLFDKSESINTAISMCDLIITTPSTVILDAMFAHKPVVCLVSENSRRYVNNLNDYITIVYRDMFCIDDYAKLYNNHKLDRMIAKQDEFLNDIYFKKPVYTISELLKNEVNNLRTGERKNG